MNDEWLLFGLRLAAALSLLSFVGMVGFMLWRDYRRAAEAIVAQTQQRGRLIVTASDSEAVEVGTDWALMPFTTIGRAATNTIHISEPFISNEHALIQWREGQWWLEDLDSSNGTFINHEPVEEPIVLSSGDMIGFGSIEMRLELN